MMSAARKRTDESVVLGWYEYVDLPHWKIQGLRAKIDTGARTTAIHVTNLEELPGGRVRFEVRLRRRNVNRRVTVETRVHKRGRVKTSPKHTETRIFVITRLRIGPLERDIEVNLVDRTDMIFRMILGRTALRGWPALVDINRSCLVSSRPQRRSGPKRPRGGRP